MTSRAILVTGSSRGLGRAIAARFAASGDRVAVHHRDSAAAAESLLASLPGEGHVLVRADMADPDAVRGMVDEAADRLGGLDVLVNNAGIAGPTGPIESIDAAGWERTIAVNLNSQYYFARRAVPMLKQSLAGPCLISMSSVAGRLGYALRTPYAASKWAIVGLTKSLAIELGPHDIRVNAILPGTVEGARMNGVIAARAATVGVSVDEMRQQYLNKISLRRMVTPDDVAALALFLCSPAARNMSGQAISIDGNVEYI